MNRFLREHFVQLTAAIVSFVAALWAVSIQVAEFQKVELLDKVVAEQKRYESQKQLQDIQEKLLAVVNEKLKVDKEDLTKLSIANELSDFGKRLDEIDQNHLALRQAINPLKPDEVLTIARLTDEVTALKSEFGDFEKTMSDKHKEFSASILRELKSSNDATNLILVVLIPLLLNFLYTVWKDFKSERQENTPNNQSQSDA